MAKIKYDGVVETAHFKPDGQLEWVRVYIRRGPIFSDRILLNRETFIEILKSGKSYWVGERIFNMGGKFKVTQPVHLLQRAGNPVIVVGDAHSAMDELPGVPII
jgi:hypothetical protein